MGLVASGVVAGIGVLWLVQRAERTDAGPVRVQAIAQPVVVGESNDEVAALRAHYEGQVAALSSENDALRSQVAAAAGIKESRMPPTSEQLAKALDTNQEMLKGKVAIARQRETDALLAAGFSKSRIDWIRSRAEEMEAQHKRVPPDTYIRPQYMADYDLDLRKEIGDDEYERYRVALGRSAGVVITEVSRGSLAESAGLKSGDVIVGYGGKRVFNQPEMSYMIYKEGNAGDAMSMDVRRDGQTIRLTIPRGDPGIRAAAPVTAVSRALGYGVNDKSLGP